MIVLPDSDTLEKHAPEDVAAYLADVVSRIRLQRRHDLHHRPHVPVPVKDW